MGGGVQSSELSQTREPLANPAHAKASPRSKRAALWLLSRGGADEFGGRYVNVDESWTLLRKARANDPEEQP